MKFSVSSSLNYHAFEPSTVICSVSCHETPGQKIVTEKLTVSRVAVTNELIVGLNANRLVKIDVDSPGNFTVNYEATVSVTPQIVDNSVISAGNKSSIDATTLPYLNPSRYAPADRMRKAANELFGRINGVLQQALAIEDWLYENLTYEFGASKEQSWSLETYETRVGVCRDYAHLGIAFCRALSIPARYVTVYSYQLNPQDFHAVFEVYIGGSWIVLDGTRLAPLNGMVRIATGLDASETAFGTLIGNIQGQGVYVFSLIAMDEREWFIPVTRESLRNDDQVLILG